MKFSLIRWILGSCLALGVVSPMVYGRGYSYNRRKAEEAKADARKEEAKIKAKLALEKEKLRQKAIADREKQKAEEAKKRELANINWNQKILDAIQQENTNLFNEAIRNGARFDAATRKNGDTALHIAIRAESERFLKFLISKNKLPIDVRNQAMQTPLHLAAILGNEKLIAILLSNQANIESVSGNGRTAIQYAVENNHLNCVRLLLEHGAIKTKEVLRLARTPEMKELLKINLKEKDEEEQEN